MDKTKVRIDLTEAWTALERLDQALNRADMRSAGAEIFRLRQALERLQNSTGVKLEFVNLQPDPPAEYCTCAEAVRSTFDPRRCAVCRKPIKP